MGVALRCRLGVEGAGYWVFHRPQLVDPGNAYLGSELQDRRSVDGASG